MSAVLRRGNRGPDVTRLQNLLNAKLQPSPNLVPDGDFGGKTEAAVRRFQTAAGLTSDGVMGPNTWGKLEAGGPLTAPVAPTPPANEATVDPPWLTIAQGEAAAGVREFAKDVHNPRIIEYHATTTLRATKDETPWCASFVNWCVKQAGYAGTNSALAASWTIWGKALDGPRRGAITVIYNAGMANSSLTASGNHVGFLLRETESNYVILGGNQGDAVKESSFPKSRWSLKAYRWAE